VPPDASDQPAQARPVRRGLAAAIHQRAQRLRARAQPRPGQAVNGPDRAIPWHDSRPASILRARACALMPGFASAFTDQQIAAWCSMSDCVRTQAAWPRARKSRAEIRAGGDKSSIAATERPASQRGHRDGRNQRQRDHASGRRRPSSRCVTCGCATGLQLKRAKFGCGLGQCVACTVMVRPHAVYSVHQPRSRVENPQHNPRSGARHAGGSLAAAAAMDEQARNAVLAPRNDNASEGADRYRPPPLRDLPTGHPRPMQTIL